jgi:hypothetical protein
VRFFRRGETRPDGDFWTWWTSGRDRGARAITSGGFDRVLVNDITRAVRTVHAAMAWELAPSRAAEHAFRLR